MGGVESQGPADRGGLCWGMTARRYFSARLLRALRDGKILGLRAGGETHRFIGIWVVVVERRVFVRSWGLKASGWYHALRAVPRALLSVEGREIRARAVHTRSERLRAAVDRAYLEKYDSPGSVRYARDLGRARSRSTTTELVPV